MTADGVARDGTVEVERSGADGLDVRVQASDGAYYSFHLHRGTELVQSTPYARDDRHTFVGLGPGSYLCRVFVRTVDEDRFVVNAERVVIDAGPSNSVPDGPAPAAASHIPDPRWSSRDDLPADSDYSTFLPAVFVWPSVDAFAEANAWGQGVHVVRLADDLHVDLFLGGDPGQVPPGRGLPVVFSGAVSGREEGPGPFFSGAGLARSVGSPFVAISDATLNHDSTLTLGWYAGRRDDGLQPALLAILTAVQRRYDRELVLVGGSGGGFAALHHAARLEVPVSAFVWNPQTDLLDYQPSAVDRYLLTALAVDPADLDRMSRADRSTALLEGGVEHRVLPDAQARGQRRVLYLQSSRDSHVVSHLAPYVEQGGLQHVGGGRYVDETGVLVLVSAFSDGHEAPAREVLVRGLRDLLDVSRSAAEVVDELQRHQLLPSTDLDTLPRDLRPDADLLRRAVRLVATRVDAGRIRAELVWDGLPNRYGGTSTRFEFLGHDEPFSRSHRENAVVVADERARVTSVRAWVRDGHLNELFTLDVDVDARPAQPARLRTFVFGSCVSRDTFAFLAPRHFVLSGYIARQSLVSAFGPRTTPPVDPVLLPSAFQRRVLEADADSSLGRTLRDVAGEVDLLLWDLFDERLGILEHLDGGVSTDSVEVRGLLGDVLPVELQRLPFGSRSHLERFTAVLPQWRDLLTELDLIDRTVLVAPPWAELSDEGEPTPTSFGLDAGTANELVEPYLAAAQAVLGVPTVGRFLPSVRSCTTHQWGPAPFHYDDWTYERLATEISALAEQLCHPVGWDASDPHGRTRVPTAAQRGAPGTSGPTGSDDDGEPSVELTQTGPLEVTATLRASDMKACAFSLLASGRQLAITAYQPDATHSFRVSTPGIYRCRAFVLRPDGERVPVTSSPLRVL